jgi:hypothetical protein
MQRTECKALKSVIIMNRKYQKKQNTEPKNKKKYFTSHLRSSPQSSTTILEIFLNIRCNHRYLPNPLSSHVIPSPNPSLVHWRGPSLFATLQGRTFVSPKHRKSAYINITLHVLLQYLLGNAAIS